MNKKDYPILGLLGLIVMLIITGCVQKPKNFNETLPADSQDLSNQEIILLEQEMSVIVDCGETKSPIMLGENPNEDAVSAWECFVDNIESCTPTKLKSTFVSLDDLDLSTGTDIEYEIIGEKNGVCQIMGPSVNFETGDLKIITCDFTEELIQYGFKQAEIAYPEKKFMKGFILMGYISAGCKGGPGDQEEVEQQDEAEVISKTPEQLCEETGGIWKGFNVTAEDCAKITNSADCYREIEGCTWKSTKEDLPDGGINIISECVLSHNYCDCPSKHWRDGVGCMPRE